MRSIQFTVLAGSLSIALGACAVQPGLGDDDGGDDGGGDDGGGDSPCGVGTLFAGDPIYNGDALPATGGTPLLADPPVRMRDLVFDGPRLYTHVGEEIWGGDRSSLHRIVGVTQPGAAQFRAGACADARLGYTDGLVVLADGSLIVADFNANAIVKVTDPLGPTCAVSYYAGTSTAVDAVFPDDPPNVGNVDGIGGAAKFALPGKPVAAPDGTIYVLDDGNHSIRKIVPSGAVGAVSTVPFAFTGADSDITWIDLAYRNGKLILIGNTFLTDSYVLEVDPTTGAYDVLVSGDGAAFPPADEGRNPILSSVATDGERLFVSGSGRIWQITDSGDVIHAAGAYSFSELFDFPFPGYDPAGPHDALDLALKYIGDAQSSQFMTFDGDELYYAARGTGTGNYALAISCPR